MKIIIGDSTEEITTRHVCKIGERMRITREDGSKRWVTLKEIRDGVPVVDLLTSAAPSFVQMFPCHIGKRRG